MKINQPQLNIGKILVGGDSRIVGVITKFETLENWEEKQAYGCNLVEVRLDLVGADQNKWVDHVKWIEATGKPIVLTIRLAAEQGQWVRADQDRVSLFKRGLKVVSAVDVELRSEILPIISQESKLLNKCTIVSYHDFDKTPPLVELEDIVRQGSEFGQIVKIATMVRSVDDIEILKSLLKRSYPVPLCVIGMGLLGRDTRIMFPSLRSCLAYGYLDQPSAPGQLSVRELEERIRSNESNSR